MFKVKRNPSGEVSNKARLVVRGFNQKPGVDFQETFSPVVRFDTLRSVLSVAASENLHLAQFDVKTAFLNGHLFEDIYMTQSEGFSDSTDRVCKLLRSIYGLKQSPRCWNQRFKDEVSDLGLSESTDDPCLLVRNVDGNKLLVVLYVDGLVAATRKSDAEEFLKQLQSRFKIAIEKFGCFLNLQISQEKDGSVVIHQQSYAESVLRRFKMDESNPVSTPIDQYIRDTDELELTSAPYREAIDCLMYLAVATRPDIAFAVRYASQFLEKPETKHWSLVKRILRYLRGTTAMGIHYPVSAAVEKHQVLHVFSDAEYVAACEAAKEAVWLKRLFKDIAPLKSFPMLCVDSASAMKLVLKTQFHKKTASVVERLTHCCY